jgi:hypothetical protein
VTQPAVQVWTGAAFAARAVAPRALRVEDAVARGRVGGRGGRRRPRLCERGQRHEQRQRRHEDAKPSSHAPDYTAASRRRCYCTFSGSTRLASAGSLTVVTAPSGADPTSILHVPGCDASSLGSKCSYARTLTVGAFWSTVFV